ncbi:MAG: hypothetical protein U1E60_15090 [Reyranellaceae bacterium]
MFDRSSTPILSTVPRSGTWFLRYTISFLSHLERGGRIEDRLTGHVYGCESGPAFDFERFRGGPLFRVRGALPVDNLFIGHTVCPGFAGLGRNLGWWAEGTFHVPGYDYFHEGMNYRYTPVDLAPNRYTPIRVPAMEREARRGRGGRIALVYRNPIDQAASYYRYCQEHRDIAYCMVNGRPLTVVPFRDYLFKYGLPSYARQFISFQEMAARHPDHVKLMAYERMVVHPVAAVAALLDHFAGARRDWQWLTDAVFLARRDHMKTIEKQLGRSLDGTRRTGGSHIRRDPTKAEGRGDLKLRREALDMLEDLGVQVDLFEFPVAEVPAVASAA